MNSNYLFMLLALLCSIIPRHYYNNYFIYLNSLLFGMVFINSEEIWFLGLKRELQLKHGS